MIQGADGRRLTQLQYDTALAAKRPMLLWQSRSFDASKADPAYVDFLNQASPHILSIEEFQSFAEKDIARTFKLLAAARNRVKSVAIDAAPEDAELQQMLAEALQTHVGVESVDYEPDSDTLERAALANDAVMLVWGASKAGQKRTSAHLGFLRRFVGPDGMSPAKAIGNAAPPPPTAPIPPGGPDVSVVSIKDGVNLGELSAFLEKLGIPAAQPST